MAYLSSIHRPSSVRHALKLNLFEPDIECLVMAKGPRLEVWKPADEAFVMTESHHIFGSICMLAKIRPIGANTDILFVGTQQLQYFTLGLDPDTNKLKTLQTFHDNEERAGHDAQSRELCLVDPAGQYLVLELVEGVLNLIKLQKPRKNRPDILDAPQPTRIFELKVRSSTFLYTETKSPKIAFLITDITHGDVRLVTYRICDDKGQISKFEPTRDRENELVDLDPGASHLIPVSKGDANDKRYIVRNSTVVKAHLGGVVVIGQTRFLYLDDESKATIEYPLEEASIFTSWEKIDNVTYLLGDFFGFLHLLTIQVNNSEVTGMQLRKIGQISKATVMIYLWEGIFFIGSHEGDSQFIKLDIEGAKSGTTLDHDLITLIQVMPNIAPILDFSVMDMGGNEGASTANEYSTGQARIVAGSGAYESGSIKSIRSGVGLEDIGILTEDMMDVQDLFSLRSSPTTPKHDTLVVSSPIETRVFLFDSVGEIEEVEEFRGMSLGEETLLAMNLADGFILQVTPSSARILGPGPSYVASQWTPPAGQVITTVSANDGYVLLAANGVNLISLDIKSGLQELVVQNLQEGNQVACIHVTNVFPNIGIVGFWNSGTISILDLTNLDIRCSEDLRRKNDASIPRNICLERVLLPKDGGPTLFVAMEDGTVLTFNVDKKFQLSGRKSIVLGTSQARFHILPRISSSCQVSNIFATCDNPSLIYGSEGRIVYSAITADSAQCVCPFDSEAYPDSIVLASTGVLKISVVDSEKRTHVRTLPLGYTVRRIAYSQSQRAFGVGSISRKLEDNVEVISNTFQLVEDMMFTQIGKPFTFDSSNGPELIECLIRTEIQTSNGEPAERFLVGTTFLSDEHSEQDRRGRILIFGIDNAKTTYLIHSLNLKCACRRLAMLEDKIVAVLYKTVVVYNYTESSSRAASLTKAATYRCVTVPMDISVTGNTIAVADMMQSLSLIEFHPGINGLPSKLEQVARDYNGVWATAVADLGNDTYLESDGDGNLLMLWRNRKGVTEEDRKRMGVVGSFHLGEMVNVIRGVEVAITSFSIVEPKAFLATTEGSIYLLSLLTPLHTTLLLQLQDRCAAHISTHGHTDFKRYRRFRSSTGSKTTGEPYRFVDGELVERFLDVGEDVQREICVGLGVEASEIRGMVEELKRLH